MDAHICSSHKLFLSPNSVSLGDRAIRIGQKSERKFIFRLELFMGCFAVWRNTQYSDSSFFELRKSVAKRAGFFGAAGGVVFGIKIKYYLLTAKFFRTDSFTVGIFGFERRRSSSFFDHVSSSG